MQILSIMEGWHEKQYPGVKRQPKTPSKEGASKEKLSPTESPRPEQEADPEDEENDGEDEDEVDGVGARLPKRKRTNMYTSLSPAVVQAATKARPRLTQQLPEDPNWARRRPQRRKEGGSLVVSQMVTFTPLSSPLNPQPPPWEELSPMSTLVRTEIYSTAASALELVKWCAAMAVHTSFTKHVSPLVRARLASRMMTILGIATSVWRVGGRGNHRLLRRDREKSRSAVPSVAARKRRLTHVCPALVGIVTNIFTSFALVKEARMS